MGGFQQSDNKHQNCGFIPIFSEFVEIFDPQIPFFQSSEGNISTALEYYDQQAQDHHIFEVEANHQMVHLEKVEQYSSMEQSRVCTSNNDHDQSDSSMGALRKIVKPRMKWTRDLHERFVECVTRLGGAEKATPKAILKLMSSNKLTVFHVKSHLQKYRTSKYVAEYSKEKCENRAIVDETFQLDMKSGMQIKEALQHVNRRLHEQLEIQKNLQLLIEEQGKQLKMIEKANKSLFMKSLQISSVSPISQNDPSNSFDDTLVSLTQDSGSSHSLSDV